MLANQTIQFQEVQTSNIYFLEARSVLRPCHVHINVATWSFANMAIPSTDASLQASWDISWQGIRRTVRTSQSHAPPEEQSWTKANRKHTRNSLTPRTPRICLGNERGLVRELDTTMNNGRQKKLCELSHYSCCMLLKVASWSLKAATCNVVMPSPFNMPRGTRRGAQNNTEHDTRIIWDELIHPPNPTWNCMLFLRSANMNLWHGLEWILFPRKSRN